MDIQETGEGMVNPEKWKSFVGALEKMGEAKAIIVRSLGLNYDAVQVEKQILEVYSGDRGEAAMLIRAAKIFGIYHQAVDGEWKRWTGSVGSAGDKIEGEKAAEVYEEVSGLRPKGNVVLRKTDITVHLDLEKEEDLSALIRKDLKENGKTMTQFKEKNLGGIALDLRSKEGKRGMFTAQKSIPGETRNVLLHEREHLVQRIFARCDLIDWGRKKQTYPNKRYITLAVWATLPVLDVESELAATVDVMAKAGQAGSGQFDEMMVNERAAIQAEGINLNQEALISHLSNEYGCDFVLGALEKYLMVLNKQGRFGEWETGGGREKAKELIATLVSQNLDVWKVGLRAEERLIQFYGDKEKVKGMLEYMPLRYWPVAERMIMKYGTIGNTG